LTAQVAVWVSLEEGLGNRKLIDLAMMALHGVRRLVWLGQLGIKERRV